MPVAHAAEQIAFDFVPHTPVVVQRHDGQITSDAGLLPVAQFDANWRYTDRLAACLADDGRADPEHSAASMVRQRVFGIVAGHEDCNGHDDLRGDPAFEMAAGGRRPDGDPAGQPADPVAVRERRHAGRPGTAGRVPRRDRRRAAPRPQRRRGPGGAVPAAVTLDVDATDDPAHGNQQLALFHGYYGQHQYYPLVVTEPTTKHAFVATLRHGTAAASLGADDDLTRVVAALRVARPGVAVHVRGDRGFGLPLTYDLCEANGLTYTFGLGTNARLKRLAGDLTDRAAEQYRRTGEKARLFARFEYRADGWPHPRTAVAKAECHAGGTNLRFVVTNLPGVTTAADAGRVYDEYVARGEGEHRMDELKNGLSAGRLSCHRFMANAFRLALHVAAYNPLNALRDDPAVPDGLRVGRPDAWRTRVVKVAAEVVATTRRAVVRLAGQWPHWDDYVAVAARALAFRPSSA